MTVLALRILHSPSLKVLGDALATVMASPLSDPFATEVVAVPTVGLRDWLQQHLALRLGAGSQGDGICANVQMVFPNRFTAAALGHGLAEDSPWDLERLTWTVLEVLHAGQVHVPGYTIRHSRAGPGTGAYSTARRIADLFDRYANQRPQLLRQWHAGHDGDGTEDEHSAVVPLPAEQRWQAHLWRAVRCRIGRPTIAEQMPELLEDLRYGRLQPALPERVAVFGVSALSSAQIAMLQALGQVRDVHLHIVHPSPAAWDQCRQQLAGRLVLRSASDATAAVHHPLLRSWGRPPMETAALVAGLDADHADLADRASACQPERQQNASLLSRVQSAVITDTPPVQPEAGGLGAAVDRSIQVHACHGTTRQLEVLRDALGHLFANDSTLAAHEVLILCPDLSRFAPLIQSVFGRSSLPIPVRVSDLSLGDGNPVAEALDTLLATISGRCTGPELLQLLTLPPVQRAFGFGDEDGERISGWINDLGTTWGLDGEHRGQWVPDHIVEGTWASTLDRLLLGAAMPAPVARVASADIVPFDDVDAAGFALVGRLAELITRLRQARSDCSGVLPIDRWVDLVNGLITTFFVPQSAEAWQVAEVVAAISDVARNGGGSDVPLTMADARSIVGSVLAEDRGRLSLRSGSVTATSLVPVRNVPARVVCVLGLDDVSLRSTGLDGDDILGLRPCVGERDQRTDGRHMLLDALMSAGDHLIITCDGSDITTNRAQPLPIYLAELIDVVATSQTTGELHPIVSYHPRQAYDERNLITSSQRTDDGTAADFAPGSPFTFDTAMLVAARARRTAVNLTDPWPLLEPTEPANVSLSLLAEACTRPAKTFVQRRLDAQIPQDVEQARTNIPIKFTGLDQYQLGHELLDLRRVGASEDVIAGWRAAHRTSGALPPRSLADAVLDDTENEVGIILAAPELGNQLFEADDSHEIELTLDLPGSSCVVQLRDRVSRIAGHRLIRVTFTRPGPRPMISAVLELAALVAQYPEHPWEALVVMRPKTSGAQKATASRLRPTNSSRRRCAAIHLLEVAVAFHHRALREPLPFFEKSSKTLYETRTIDDDEYGRDLMRDAAGFLWSGYTADDVLSIPLRADDELTVVRSSDTGCGRAQAFADAFWNAYEAFIPPTPTVEVAPT